MQCVILAGGLGTRMLPRTEEIPKALVPVNGVPFAHRQLDLLARNGITEVLYSIGHLGGLLRDAVGDGHRWGMTVRYVDEGLPLRGTGGALRSALDAGALEPSFLVLYGDSYLPIRYADVSDAFRTSGLPALMTVLRNDDRWDASNVQFEEGRILRYDKRARGAERERMHHIDYGLSAIERRIIDARVDPTGFSDLADLYRDLSVDGLLAGLEVDQRFYEVGSPEGLAELEAHLGSPPGQART